MRWLWGNWELKAVSLVVAVALWTYTSGQVRVERSLQVEIRPEQIIGLPPDLRAVLVTPGQFTVVLSVPTRKVDDLRDEVLRPQISVSRERRGSDPVEVPLTSRTLGLDSDIRIQRSDPPNLQAVVVQLAAIIEANLPAEPPPVVGLPAGLAADVVLDRTQVAVRGTREVVDAANERHRLRFAPIRLEGIAADLAAPHEEQVEVVPLPGQPEPVSRVMARVTVRPDHFADARVRVAVAVLLPAGEIGRWAVGEGELTAELAVHGPDTAIRALIPADIPAWVDLRGAPLAAGAIDRPLRVTLPTGVGAAPASVHLTLRPVAAAP